MKPTLSFLIFLAFAVMTAFGFSMIDHGGSHESGGGCAVSALTGSCTNAIAGALRHQAETLDLFSNAAVSSIHYTAFLLLLLGAWVFSGNSPPVVSLARYALPRREGFHFRTQTFTRWLALFFNSPSF